MVFSYAKSRGEATAFPEWLPPDAVEADVTAAAGWQNS
jgi:hypothetical protein